MWIPNLLSIFGIIGKDEEKKESDEREESPAEVEPPGIKKVGAWCGMSSLAKPEQTVSFAKKVRLNRLDVIVNDHAAARESVPFDTYTKAKIISLCTKAKSAGLDVHLMSWIMPHEAYILEAAKQLIPLAQECQATSIQWDAEEPWTQAKKAMTYPDAAKLIAEKFANVVIGVNGIGYTPENKFGPLARVCQYVVPQCYATNTSGIRPEDAVPLFIRRYNKLFQPSEIVVGAAAYRQSGIPNHTVESAMKTVLAGAQALENIHTVIYWSLGHIQSSLRVQSVIKNIPHS